MNKERRPFRRISTEKESDTVEESRGFPFGSAKTLARDMSKIVNRRLFSDVVFFVGPERVKIFGHKCILSARNEYFRQLFTNAQNGNSFEILSPKPVTFLLFLYFLYTNSISFDRLHIYEVFDLLKTAKDYKCNELTSLAEIRCGFLLEPKTAFELLPEAIHLDLEFLRNAALEFIEESSSILLSPTNDNILSLTPAAMKSILESDFLELDELRVIELACFWAERFLQRSKETNQSRITIINRRHIQRDSIHDFSEEGQVGDMRQSETTWSYSSYMQQTLKDVAMVMGALRLVLLSPNDLAKLEEEQLEKRLIPRECFINAWRYLALQAAQLPSSDMSVTNVNATPRKGTMQRTQRQKPSGDSAKLTRTFV